MIEWWLDQSAWLVFGALVVLFGIVSCAVHVAMFGFGAQRRGSTVTGVAPPLFGAIAVLFGLLLGFVANDAWERNRQATRAILGESDSLLALNEISIATVSDMSSIRAALRRYGESVVGDEWPRMEDGEPSAKTAAALGDVLRQIADPKVSAEAGPAAHRILMDLALRLRTQRSDRLAILDQHADTMKWWSVLILAMVTLVTLGSSIPNDRPPRRLLSRLSPSRPYRLSASSRCETGRSRGLSACHRGRSRTRLPP